MAPLLQHFDNNVQTAVHLPGRLTRNTCCSSSLHVQTRRKHRVSMRDREREREGGGGKRRGRKIQPCSIHITVRSSGSSAAHAASAATSLAANEEKYTVKGNCAPKFSSSYSQASVGKIHSAKTQSRYDHGKLFFSRRNVLQVLVITPPPLF